MSGIRVKFYENVPDEKLKFAVIASKYNGKWVWCKHRERDTYEIPGGLTYPLIQPYLAQKISDWESSMGGNTL